MTKGVGEKQDPCHLMFMLSVCASDELPELVKRLHNPPGSLIELFPRMDDDDDDVMKKVVQEVLRGLHLHFSGYSHMKEHLSNSSFTANIFLTCV